MLYINSNYVLQYSSIRNHYWLSWGI